MPNNRFYVGLINIMIMVPGLVLLAAGLIIVYQPFTLLNFVKAYGTPNSQGVAGVVYRLRFVILYSGVAILVPPAIAFTGMFFYSKLLVSVYGIIMFSSIVFLLVLLIFGIMFTHHLEPHVERYMYKTLAFYRGDEDLLKRVSGTEETVTFIWNYMQVKFRCCGARNRSDFFENRRQWFGQEMGVPVTCCRKYSNLYLRRFDFVDIDKCRLPNLEKPYMNKKSCSKALKRFIVWAKQPLVVAVILLISLQVFMLCLLFLVVFPSDKGFLLLINRW